MEWLLTVPLLLPVILLEMKLPASQLNAKAWTLGLGSALVIVSGCGGGVVVAGGLTPRWICWFVSMVFSLYIVFELVVGLSAATNAGEDEGVKG